MWEWTGGKSLALVAAAGQERARAPGQQRAKWQQHPAAVALAPGQRTGAAAAAGGDSVGTGFGLGAWTLVGAMTLLTGGGVGAGAGAGEGARSGVMVARKPMSSSCASFSTALALGGGGLMAR